MKVILLKDIKGVGKRFEEKEVSDGHATNFLIPRKLAVALSGSGAALVKNLKEAEEKNRAQKNRILTENISKIAGTTVSIQMKANDRGHLFASINPKELSQILKKEKGVEIDPEHINLNKAIKETGTFEVPVTLGEGKETKFTLEVTPLA